MLSRNPWKQCSQNLYRWCSLPLNWRAMKAWKLVIKQLTLISQWLTFWTTNPLPRDGTIWIELFIRSIISNFSSSDGSVVKDFEFVFAWQSTLVSSVGFNICTKTESWNFKGQSSAILLLTNNFRSSNCSVTKLNTSIWLSDCNPKHWKNFSIACLPSVAQSCF